MISGVNRFGFFVELNTLYVDGLVHVNSLKDDYYVFNNVHHQLVGERTKKQYTLGMAVNVIIAKVNVDERKIDFSIVADKKQPTSVRNDESVTKKKPARHKNKKASTINTTITQKKPAKTKNNVKNISEAGSSVSKSKKRPRRKPSGKPKQQ